MGKSGTKIHPTCVLSLKWADVAKECLIGNSLTGTFQNDQMLKGKWAPTRPRLMSGRGSNATCCGFSQRPTFQPFWVCKNQILQPFTIHSRTSLSNCLCCPKGSSFHLNRFSSHSITSLFLGNICTGAIVVFLWHWTISPEHWWMQTCVMEALKGWI